MPFLFPGTMARRALVLAHHRYFKIIVPSHDVSAAPSPQDTLIEQQKDAVRESLEAYTFLSQGWGYLASFLRGTQAYLARQALSETVDQLSDELKKKIKPSKNLSEGGLAKYRDLLALQGPLIGAILSPALIIVIENFELVNDNNKLYLNTIIFSFPILKEFYNTQHGWFYFDRSNFAKLFHNLLNPVRLLDDFLLFLKKSLIRTIEIGSTKFEESGPIRKVLKGGVSFLFSVIEIPVKALSTITDIPYQILKACYYAPQGLVSLFKKKQNYDTNKYTIILKANDADQIDAWIQPPSDPSLSSTAQTLKLTKLDPKELRKENLVLVSYWIVTNFR